MVSGTFHGKRSNARGTRRKIFSRRAAALPGCPLVAESAAGSARPFATITNTAAARPRLFVASTERRVSSMHPRGRGAPPVGGSRAARLRPPPVSMKGSSSSADRWSTCRPHARFRLQIVRGAPASARRSRRVRRRCRREDASIGERFEQETRLLSGRFDHRRPAMPRRSRSGSPEDPRPMPTSMYGSFTYGRTRQAIEEVRREFVGGLCSGQVEMAIRLRNEIAIPRQSAAHAGVESRPIRAAPQDLRQSSGPNGRKLRARLCERRGRRWQRRRA